VFSTQGWQYGTIRTQCQAPHCNRDRKYADLYLSVLLGTHCAVDIWGLMCYAEDMNAQQLRLSLIGLLFACGGMTGAGWLGMQAAGGKVYAKEGQAMSRVRKLRRIRRILLPLHKKLGKPKPGEWLAEHEEEGQTFSQYRDSRPMLPRGKRKVLYIQPLGDFTEKQRQVVERTAEFMALYFGLEAKIRKDIPLKVIPKRARRIHPQWKDKQIVSTYVLDELLKPNVPKDAAALIAFTSSDLWPGKGWNFVFGQASLRRRVGVWSIYRNGDPDAGTAQFRKCLLRTMQTATHETGHIFSIKHCIFYECNMCGSNSREESDRRPILLCPECLCKVCWGLKLEPLERYRTLHDFCKKNELKKQAAAYAKSIAALEENN